VTSHALWVAVSRNFLIVQRYLRYLNKDISDLVFYSRRLYRAAAKLNLYIIGDKTAINNTKRVKGLLRDVKLIIWSIERELSEL